MLQHLIEYAGLRLGLFLLDHISPASAIRLAHGLADLWYALNASRRRIACDNIRRAGIASDPREIRRVARESFRHLAILVVESIQSDRILSESNWRDHVQVDVPAETMSLLTRPGQGVILVSGHFGNWEIAAQLLSFLKPIVGITKKMHNPWSDRLMQRRKPRNRFRIIPMRDADSGRFLAVLKAGEILAILVDQYAKGHRFMVDFFGIPAATHPSPAMLHLVTRTPICFGYCLRTGPMKFRLVTGAPLAFLRTGNRQQDVQTILLALNRELEAAIRRHPEQYLWAHRRWRSLPSV